jgi:hypothetical protein
MRFMLHIASVWFFIIAFLAFIFWPLLVFDDSAMLVWFFFLLITGIAAASHRGDY